MSYSGIIFDFNGTLFWDSDKHEKAWRFIAQKLRPEELSAEELQRKIQGRTNPAIIRYLSREPLDDRTVAELSMEKERIYRRLCFEDPENLRLATGADALLDFLAEKRIPRTIATSSERTNLDFYLETFRLARWFDPDLIVYDDGSFPGKPEPHIYLKAAAKIGLRPAECIVVEDTISGVRSAKLAGIGKVLLIGPREKYEELKRIEEADGIIHDFGAVDRNWFKPPET